jgi:hypothetical protein
MKREHVILAANLGVLLLYMVLVRFSVEGSEKELGIMIFSAFLIGVHVLVNLMLAALVGQNKKAFLLSALLVLLIGFSTCIYGAS